MRECRVISFNLVLCEFSNLIESKLKISGKSYFLKKLFSRNKIVASEFRSIGLFKLAIICVKKMNEMNLHNTNMSMPITNSFA